MKETEQTLLDQIKDDVAKENGCEDWHTYDKKIRYTPLHSLVWKQVCERYATAKAQASCEATLKKASENANVSGTHPSRGKEPYIGKSIHANHSGWDIVVDKSSITDPKNITIV